MADWSLPGLTSLYTAVLSILKDRDVDAITLGLSTPTNPPTGAIRYVRASNKFQEYDGAVWNDKVLAVEGGGTGASTAANARTALGLGTLATQNSNNVNITGGTIAGASLDAGDINSGVVPLNRGGTGVALALGTEGQVLGSVSGAVGFFSLSASVPVATVTDYAGAVAPTGWLLCEGQAIDRIIYADLFAAIGIVYGAGNGTTTFNIPDARGRFSLSKAASGTGSTLGSTGGAIDHKHTGPAHTHSYSGSVDANYGATEVLAGGGPPTTYAGNHAHTYSGTTGSGGTGDTGTNNPPYIVFNKIIKY